MSEFTVDPDRLAALAERSVRRGYQLRRRRRALLSGGPAVVVAIALVAALLTGGGNGAEDRLRVTRRGPDRHEPTTVPGPDGGTVPAIGGDPGTGLGPGARVHAFGVPPLAGPTPNPAADASVARLVFTDGDIKTIADDGSSLRTIVRNGAQPSVSPDGRRLAFVRMGSGPTASSAVYVAAIDGTSVRLVGRGGGALPPAWSPDGRRVAYTGGATSDVHIVNADGSGDHAVTADGVSQDPSWSPDGKRIAFLRGASSLYVMNDDGSAAQRIGPTNVVVTGPPRWSPDGRHIAFAGTDASAPPTDTERSTQQIWVVAADGTNPHRAGAEWGQAAWSPDGSRLALAGSALAIARADGTAPVKLTDGPQDLDPAWSADGTELAFDRSGSTPSLWAIETDGTHLRKLADTAQHLAQPCWIP